jgi:pyruvate, orthophosphate dikinase
LCRTERMFNAPERLPIVLDMIVAETQEQRQAALDRLLPIQRGDFRELLTAMAPRPVTIRLLDPPIHEFLPTEPQLLSDIENLRALRNAVQGAEVLSDSLRLFAASETTAMSALPPVPWRELGDSRMVDQAIARKETILRKARALREVNPMLGHRGVRLGMTYPEIYAMQIRAILEAAAECVCQGIETRVEIMVPQVCTVQELKTVKRHVERIHTAVEASYNAQVAYQFGTMIEVVRACMRADSLAETAQFFSFGTNDLTQATFSFSREDAENKFLPFYNQQNILRDNPFEVLDVMGVGRLMKIAIEWGRNTRRDLKVGICGEHGGHPASIAFCHEAGLNYVSCSPMRVPIARLAAAHAQILGGRAGKLADKAA